MTKEITKAFILQEMQDKFKLREFAPEPFTFSEAVVPIYNIEQHLEKWITEWTQVSITSAMGFVFFTVPSDEIWHLRRYDVVFMGAGAYTVSGAYVGRATGSSAYLDLTAAQTISYHIDLVNPVVLHSGDVISIMVDGYTSTQNLRLYIDYMMETIR